jgi:dihydropteroate synthase
VGGISTRPESEPISEEVELARIIPAIRLIRCHFPDTILSVDTYRSGVARIVATDYSVEIINDISGGEMDKNMFETVADLQIPYIIMHMRGSPRIMQTQTHYEDIIREIIGYFAVKISQLKLLGLNDIAIDPGFGFSKTTEQNFFLLDHLDSFRIFELPIMVGISRKSMIYKTIRSGPSDSLNGTTVLNTVALLKGANILRVHDVKEAVQTITLINKLRKADTMEISD